MERHRVAIIGLGVMGRRMLTNMAADGRFTFSGLWDPDAAACARVAAELPEVPIGTGPEEIVRAPETDLVYIACPPAWHRHYALMAAEAGKPVFCEKPLGTDLDDSRRLVAELDRLRTPNIVNFIQASSHAAELTAARIAAGELGEIIGADIVIHFSQWPRAWQASAEWLRFRDQGGFTREVFSHFLFLAERFLGKARLVWSNPRFPVDPTLCETHVQARLDCGGVPISAFGSVGGAGPDRVEFTLWGSRRSHRLHDWFWLKSSDGDGWTTEFADIDDLRAANFARLLDNVSAFIQGRPQVLPGVQAALSVQELVEAMLAA